MEIKIQCGCGTKYKFDVEPVNGRMPVPATCPSCGANGTFEANQQITQRLGTSSPAPAPMTAAAPVAVATAAPPATGLRIAGGARSAAAAILTEGEPLHDPAGAAESGRALLQRTKFLVKERVAGLKLTDTYDILDPVTGVPIGIAKEEPPVWAKWARLAGQKHRLPPAINIYENESQPPVLSIIRGFTFIRQKINVVSGGRTLGYFKSKLISIGGGFHVYDETNQVVAEMKGNLVGWEFRFLNKSGREIGTVSKKWAGALKELLTSADNYVIALTDLSGASPDAPALLLAAGLAIDIVYKEDE